MYWCLMLIVIIIHKNVYTLDDDDLQSAKITFIVRNIKIIFNIPMTRLGGVVQYNKNLYGSSARLFIAILIRTKCIWRHIELCWMQIARYNNIYYAYRDCGLQQNVLSICILYICFNVYILHIVFIMRYNNLCEPNRWRRWPSVWR